MLIEINLNYHNVALTVSNQATTKTGFVSFGASAHVHRRSKATAEAVQCHYYLQHKIVGRLLAFQRNRSRGLRFKQHAYWFPDN